MPTVAPRRPTASASSIEAASSRPVLSGAEGTESFRWTREQYDRIVEAGVLTPDDKVELLDGQIVPKMPQNTPHSVATSLTASALRSAFGAGYYAQEEKPVALSAMSEPEPDVAVIAGNPRDHINDHPGPEAIRLIVEVADSSLVRDRVRKAGLYAAADIGEYWIVNLVGGVLEVFRDPEDGAYQTKSTHRLGSSVTPVARPNVSVPVADLLP